jgi:hypothetical protein
MKGLYHVVLSSGIAAALCVGCATAGEQLFNKGLEDIKAGRTDEGMTALAQSCDTEKYGPACWKYAVNSKSDKTRVEYHKKACDIAGYLESCVEYATFIKAKNPSEAKDVYSKACQRKDWIMPPPTRKEAMAKLADELAQSEDQLSRAQSGILIATTKSLIVTQKREIAKLNSQTDETYNAGVKEECDVWKASLKHKDLACSESKEEPKSSKIVRESAACS